ncbi:MAG TPA: SDR family NAD(P)-dependent oxidoreductase [Jatrophihabitantaceae bacterium]|jgi:short-subunit dehydrogenase|nr:SDR family NAD(P)-dependent oxidoreductase [Jatrophihabitantaceae bacterium]
MNRTVLVLGAGPRLGGAIARRFGRDGYDVALLARTAGPVEQLATALRSEGINAAWATADVADEQELGAQIARLAERGPITVAVHNVSVWRDATALAMSPADLLADVAAGAGSLLTLARAVAPAMIASGGGTILATGSAAADAPSPGAPSLGVQKAALRALVQAMARDLAPQGVHCATVTINGVLGSSEVFDPARIADVYAELVAETAGARGTWRAVVPYPA